MTVEQIDSGHIQLWLAYLGEITDPRLLAEYRVLLSEEELQKQRRFCFERDRRRYLVTRAMVRTVLSKYADVVPRDWKFAVNPCGKPAIATGQVAARGLEFNVSHTDSLVVLGVTRECALGVDVENVRARQVDMEIADRYFASEEVAALRALPCEKQPLRFFEYWTLKESYIKARGMGLSIPLDRFAFHLEESGRIGLTIDASLGDLPERWRFWQFQLEPGHLAAVCAGPAGTGPLELESPRSWP
ncbi:MAG: 4'-phosphopantetheinyl transferase family protein [Steroidobacteraceae bacterium]